MKKFWRSVGIVFLTIFLLAFFVPFLIPYVPPKGVSTLENAMDTDSQTIEINGLQVHYKEAGEPGAPLMLLLHGFGASEFSWREVMQPLAENFHVIAYDRPAFGLTERPLPGDWGFQPNPYGEEANVALVIGLMDAFDADQAVLVGNSAGGRIALAVAAAYPERVSNLVLVDSVGASGSSFSWTNLITQIPQVRELGHYAVRSIASTGVDSIYAAWYDPALVTEDIIAGYKVPLQVENWDRALFEFQRASKRPDLTEALSHLPVPALVISGEDDRIVPPETAVQLAELLPNSELVLIPECGHLPHEECPAEFLEAIEQFLKR